MVIAATPERGGGVLVTLVAVVRQGRIA